MKEIVFVVSHQDYDDDGNMDCYGVNAVFENENDAKELVKKLSKENSWQRYTYDKVELN